MPHHGSREAFLGRPGHVQGQTVIEIADQTHVTGQINQGKLELQGKLFSIDRGVIMRPSAAEGSFRFRRGVVDFAHVQACADRSELGDISVATSALGPLLAVASPNLDRTFSLRDDDVLLE